MNKIISLLNRIPYLDLDLAIELPTSVHFARNTQALCTFTGEGSLKTEDCKDIMAALNVLQGQPSRELKSTYELSTIDTVTDNPIPRQILLYWGGNPLSKQNASRLRTLNTYVALSNQSLLWKRHIDNDSDKALTPPSSLHDRVDVYIISDQTDFESEYGPGYLTKQELLAIQCKTPHLNLHLIPEQEIMPGLFMGLEDEATVLDQPKNRITRTERATRNIKHLLPHAFRQLASSKATDEPDEAPTHQETINYEKLYNIGQFHSEVLGLQAPKSDITRFMCLRLFSGMYTDWDSIECHDEMKLMVNTLRRGKDFYKSQPLISRDFGAPDLGPYSSKRNISFLIFSRTAVTLKCALYILYTLGRHDFKLNNLYPFSFPADGRKQILELGSEDSTKFPWKINKKETLVHNMNVSSQDDRPQLDASISWPIGRTIYQNVGGALNATQHLLNRNLDHAQLKRESGTDLSWLDFPGKIGDYSSESECEALIKSALRFRLSTEFVVDLDDYEGHTANFPGMKERLIDYVKANNFVSLCVDIKDSDVVTTFPHVIAPAFMEDVYFQDPVDISKQQDPILLPRIKYETTVRGLALINSDIVENYCAKALNYTKHRTLNALNKVLQKKGIFGFIELMKKTPHRLFDNLHYSYLVKAYDLSTKVELVEISEAVSTHHFGKPKYKDRHEEAGIIFRDYTALLVGTMGYTGELTAAAFERNCGHLDLFIRLQTLQMKRQSTSGKTDSMSTHNHLRDQQHVFTNDEIASLLCDASVKLDCDILAKQLNGRLKRLVILGTDGYEHQKRAICILIRALVKYTEATNSPMRVSNALTRLKELGLGLERNESKANRMNISLALSELMPVTPKLRQSI